MHLHASRRRKGVIRWSEAGGSRLLACLFDALDEVGLEGAEGVEAAGAVGERAVVRGGFQIADELDGVVDVVLQDLLERLHDEGLGAGHAERGGHVVVVEAVGGGEADGFFDGDHGLDSPINNLKYFAFQGNKTFFNRIILINLFI